MSLLDCFEATGLPSGRLRSLLQGACLSFRRACARRSENQGSVISNERKEPLGKSVA